MDPTFVVKNRDDLLTGINRFAGPGRQFRQGAKADSIRHDGTWGFWVIQSPFFTFQRVGLDRLVRDTHRCDPGSLNFKVGD